MFFVIFLCRIQKLGYFFNYRMLSTCSNKNIGKNVKLINLGKVNCGLLFSNLSEGEHEDKNYEDAVAVLNSLQTNAALLEQIRKEGKRDASVNIPATEKYLSRCSVSLNDLDKLSVIHIAGTKGKGSTCAFIESILLEHGLTTGFFSSPHLVEVRERIRINKRPISRKNFAYYFWNVYGALKKADPLDMPAYFNFLTVLGLKIFMEEKVDVAILEVGIGGEYDCTNVVRKPIVCGITKLDLDHTSLLGSTIDSIAWHKAGIMKKGSPTFTVEQYPLAYDVLLKRSLEKGVSLYKVPPLHDYDWKSPSLQLGLDGIIHYENASLAIQIANYWLNSKSLYFNECSVPHYNTAEGKIVVPFHLREEFVSGLHSIVWPGRSQVLKDGHITYYIDGAHTPISMQACIEWFQDSCLAMYNCDIYKVVVFNSTGNRDIDLLLETVLQCQFDLAIFTTNRVTTDIESKSDQANFTISEEAETRRCIKQRECWIKLCKLKKNFKLVDGSSKHEIPSIIFPCIQDVFIWLSCEKLEEGSVLYGKELSSVPEFNPPEKLKNAKEIKVLVTGSLHLVGGFLAILDPSLSCTSSSDISKSNRAALIQFSRRPN